MAINIDLLPAQDDFIFTQEPFPLVKGGLGSGKSRAGTLRLPLLMLNDKQANTAYYMPTYDLLELRAKPGVMEDLETLNIPYKENKSRNIIHLEGRGDIIFRSYDRPERIVAYEVAHSIVDELDTLKKEKAEFVWRKITERNRQKTEYMKANNVLNSIGSVTTPDQGVNGFTYEKWEKKKQKGYVTFTARTYDNIFLPPEYVEQIRANYDPILAELYLNGEYVSLSQNKIYHFFDRKVHHIKREITDYDKYLHIGLDFNIGGCVAIVAVMEDNTPLILEEFISHDTFDFINNLAKKYPNKHITVYPDASGNQRSTNSTSTDIQMIYDAGYDVSAPSGNPAVRDRINSLNSLFAHNKIFINTDNCQDLAFALESQGYDDKGDPEKFKDHPAIDDWNDALGYFIYREFGLDRPTFTNFNKSFG